MHIDLHDLTFVSEPDGWHKTVFDVLALTFGDNGQVIDQMSRTQTIRMRGNTFERAQRNGLVYNLSVPIKKAGAYQLRAALRDTATERVGSASQFIEVPAPQEKLADDFRTRLARFRSSGSQEVRGTGPSNQRSGVRRNRGRRRGQ